MVDLRASKALQINLIKKQPSSQRPMSKFLYEKKGKILNYLNRDISMTPIYYSAS